MLRGSTFDSSSPLPKSYNRNEFILNKNTTGSFSWNAENLNPGIYTVSTTWASRYNRNPGATYEIKNHDGTVLKSSTVDQNQDPADKTYDDQEWDVIGDATITGAQGDESLTITLDVPTPVNKKLTAADAVLLETNPFEIVTNYDADGDGSIRI